MKISEYQLTIEKLPRKAKIAVISDLHGSDVLSVESLLRSVKPDIILAPGDILERIDGKGMRTGKRNRKGLELLRRASAIAPTFYSLGNHEIGGSGSWRMFFRVRRPSRVYWKEDILAAVEETGAHLLEDSYLLFDGFAIGGLTSGLLNKDGLPSLSWIDEFLHAGCPKILLCHHPEYYEKYFRHKNMDIIVSGHAHGGQWRIFGRGVFAPGQGLFPRYTKGVYDDRLIVSTGIKKGGFIPRFFNPPEVVIINVN